VQNLLRILNSASDIWRDDWLIQIQSIPVCVIGPKTEQTALEFGFRRVVEARDTDNRSLVEAVIQILG
jgi:uroporphyrinogen-III synthase